MGMKFESEYGDYDEFDDLLDLDFDDLETSYQAIENLENVCNEIVDYWLEDYDFESLLEQFDILPGEAFYALVLLGYIDEDELVNYLTSDR